MDIRRTNKERKMTNTTKKQEIDNILSEISNKQKFKDFPAGTKYVTCFSLGYGHLEEVTFVKNKKNQWKLLTP